MAAEDSLGLAAFQIVDCKGTIEPEQLPTFVRKRRLLNYSILDASYKSNSREVSCFNPELEPSIAESSGGPSMSSPVAISDG